MDAIPGLGFLPSNFSSRDETQSADCATKASEASHDDKKAIEIDWNSKQFGHQVQSQNISSVDKIPAGTLNTYVDNGSPQAREEISAVSLSDNTTQAQTLPAEIEKSVHHIPVREIHLEKPIPNSLSTEPALTSSSESRETGLGSAERSHKTTDDTSASEESTDLSSDSDSSDTLSKNEGNDNDDDDMSVDEEYELLDPTEQARILMRDDADDDTGGRKGLVMIPRTANEQVEEKIQKPNITITTDMEIEELGIVENIVENFALVKGTLSNETKVLGSGSPLCLDDRTVIGSIAEPIGRVDEPRYSVAFNSTFEMQEYGINKNSKIFYPTKFAEYVFTQPLKLIKGSDASNIHDEEVGREEIEFSDDEAEAAYKKQRKLVLQAKKSNGHGVKPGSQARNFRVHYLSSDHTGGNANQILNYEDGDNDDPYVPLARPSNLYNESNAPPQLSRNLPNYNQMSKSINWRGRRRGNNSARSLNAMRTDVGQGTKDISMQPPTIRQNDTSRHKNRVYASLGHANTTSTPWTYQASSSSFPNAPLQPQRSNIPGSSPQLLETYPAVKGQGLIHDLPPGAYVNPAFFTSPWAQPKVQEARKMDDGPDSQALANVRAAKPSLPPQ